MKNIVDIEITRPNQILIIMRGLPGSGKSTIAKTMVGNAGIIHSTDDVVESKGDYKEHFKKMDELKDWSAHGHMHSINLSNSINSMKNGISPVIIDNTNIRLRETRKYIEAALELGYDDKNIQIIDIGAGGKTLEELAERNSHNVSLEVIDSMYKTYTASGSLTVKRIVDTKGEKVNKILYSAIVLDEKSRSKLLLAMAHHIPKDWDVIAHHVTVAFGKGFPEEFKNFIDANCEMKAVAIGKSDMVIAVKIEGAPSNNAIPHCTLAVNRKEGGKPVMSNDIIDWVDLENYINLSGIGKEITI